ncbi:MAG: hypothetical protein WCV92_01375 [Candidatus Buchananbacteria bacterium]
MKELLAKLNIQIKKGIQYAQYDYRMFFWLYINRWRRFVAFLKKHFDLIRQASFILVTIVMGYFVHRFGGAAFTQDILSNYLVAAGAMAGGTIAIVFTISIFLLQNASDLYSSQYFEIYVHDWREKFVYYLVIIITIALFGSGLYVGSLSSVSENISSNIVFYSLVIIGLVFALIDWQYKNVRRKLNPSNAIIFLESEGLHFLKRVQYDAKQIAGIMRAKDNNVTEGIALAAAYNRVLQPFIVNLDRQLENLVEIAMKLGDKQEVGTTKRGFTAVYKIISQFFEARKTSSLILPSGVVFLAVESDSQSFLYHNCERLNKAGEKFIKEGKDELATYVIDVYRALIKKAQEIQFVSQRNENPILDLLVSNLNFFIESGKRAENIEVVFQGLQVLGDTVTIASEKGLSLTMHGLLEKIMEIAIYGLSKKQLIIVDQCSMTFLRVIGSVFTNSLMDRRTHFNDALKNVAIISNYINTFVNAGLLSNDITTQFSWSKGYDEFYQVLNIIMNQYARIIETREKERYQADLIQLFREVNMSLRTLSEQVKSCDTILTDSIGRLLFNINNLIVDLIQNNEFKDNVKELKTRLDWNIHLPSWFAHHADKFDGSSNQFNTLTDSVAKTGILVAVRLEDKKLVQDCIDALYGLTKHTLEKTTSGYGYDQPRVLEKACYLGILALKKGWTDIVANFKVKIKEFEVNYFTKHLTNLPPGLPADFDPRNHNIMGLPHHDQLFRELSKWKSDYERERMNGTLRIRNDAEAMMYQVVERADIDKFIMEVWGVSIGEVVVDIA